MVCQNNIRITEDLDNRGSDNRGPTVTGLLKQSYIHKTTGVEKVILAKFANRYKTIF